MTTIRGYDAAERAFRELLEEIQDDLRESQAEGDAAVQEAVDRAARRLVEFKQSTRPANALDRDEANAIKRIDDLASSLRREIRDARISELVGRIEDAADDLSELTKSVEQAAEANSETARALRLTAVKKTIEDIESLVDTLKEMKSALDAANDGEKDVAIRIESLMEAFGNLRKAVSAAAS